MKNKALLSAVFASAALLGCASPRPPGAPVIDARDYQFECNGRNECTVNVEVDRGCAVFSNCLKAAYDFIVIAPGAKPTITWKLSGADADDFEFNGASGVTFLIEPKDFACGSKGGKTYQCTFVGAPGGLKVYKYVIDSIAVKGFHFPVNPLDPWVVRP